MYLTQEEPVPGELNHRKNILYILALVANDSL
jgi:hypothetical protein